MTNKILTRSILAVAILSCSIVGFAQEQEEDTGKLPVKSTFSAGMLIENPTVISPFQGALELNIQHRFANMNNGIKDIFGIYGSANTRIALNYGITDRISVGFGTEMVNKLQDLSWKVALVKQTRSGSSPVSISYYGNIVLDTHDKDFFTPKNSYRYIHRLSYLTEVIVARKFNDVLSLQIVPKFAYMNAVRDTMHKNINYGIAFGGRAKLWESKSIIFEYDQPLTSAETKSKPNLALGLEIGTATHAFQVFVTNSQNIVGQQNLAYNTNDPFGGKFEKNFIFGFNITVKF